MKEELMVAQQFAAERESARKELEGNLAEALQRIASQHICAAGAAHARRR